MCSHNVHWQWWICNASRLVGLARLDCACAWLQEHLRNWFSLLDAGGDIPGTPAARSLTAQVQLFVKVRAKPVSE